MERFDGKGAYVKLSTGGTYELYCALSALAARGVGGAAGGEVAVFLRGQLFEPRSGRGFSLLAPPEAIAAPAQLRALAALLAAFAVELCAEVPDGTLCEVPWDRDLRFRWLAFVIDLRELVLRGAGAAAAELDLVLPLSTDDRARCTFEQLQWRRAVQLRTDPAAGDALALLHQLIELGERLPRDDFARAALAQLYSSRADVQLNLGEHGAAVASLRTAAGFEDDPELRAVTLEYAAEIEAIMAEP